MTSWFPRTKSMLTLAFLAVLFWSSWATISFGVEWFMVPSADKESASSYKVLSADEEVRCRNLPSRAIIETAIKRYVDAGIAFENARQPNENNPWRYSSINNFIEINPDCCEVLGRIPGDYSIESQRLGAPYSDPARLYAVKMAFKEWQSDNSTFTRYDVILINCLGEAGEGPSFDLRQGIL